VQGKWEPKGQWRIDAAPRLSPHQRLESYFSIVLSSWRRWYLCQGACLALLGFMCLWAAAAEPVARAVSTEMLLILAGAVMLIPPLRAAQCPGFALSLALAFIPLATGAYLLGAATPKLGLTLAAYFTASGIATILLAVRHRHALFRQWEWLAVSGVTSLIVALLILAGLPGPYSWMLGVLLGVDFIFGGGARLALALALDDVP
jgi:uncharacterized membrane protein HdeD (DUF308 family)